MEKEFYILCRGDAYMVVGVYPNQDVLYGRGSWNLYSGPYTSIEEAEEHLPEDVHEDEEDVFSY